MKKAPRWVNVLLWAIVAAVICASAAVCFLTDPVGFHLEKTNTIRQSSEDGLLYVDKRPYESEELVATGLLMFENGCIQIGFDKKAKQHSSNDR